MTRPTLTNAAWSSLAAPPIGVLAGWVGLILGMRGMIAGVFIVALVPVVLLVTLPPLILGVIGRYGRAAWLRGIFVVWALVSLLVMGLAAPKVLIPLISSPPRLLPRTSNGKRALRLEFHFQKEMRVVHDPHGRLRFYDGEAPDVVSLPDGAELLVFHGDRTGLSTWTDRATVGEDGFTFGGWMGATLVDKEIRVTEEGRFDHVLLEASIWER